MSKIRPGLNEERTKLLLEEASMNLDTMSHVAKILNGYENEVFKETLDFWKKYDFSTLEGIGPQDQAVPVQEAPM